MGEPLLPRWVNFHFLFHNDVIIMTHISNTVIFKAAKMTIFVWKLLGLSQVEVQCQLEAVLISMHNLHKRAKILKVIHDT